MDNPSEHIKALVKALGGEIRSRQVKAICEFLDVQDIALGIAMDEIEKRLKKLEDTPLPGSAGSVKSINL